MKKLFVVLSLLLAAGLAHSQTVVAPFTTAQVQFFDASGLPCSACQLSTFASGTTTPLATFSDLGVTPNSNPIILDGSGVATIFLQAPAYKFVLKKSVANGGGTIRSVDGITWSTPLSTFAGITSTGDVTLSQSTAATSGANQSSNNLRVQGTYWNGAASATDQWVLQNILGTGTNPTSTLTLTHSGSSGAANFSVPGNATIGGNQAITGTLAATGLASFPGGECYTFENGKAKVIVSASCGYTTWAAALAACPSTGCILDGTAPDVPLALGAFDTGSNTKPVTVKLGPYNFTATQITVRQGLDLAGAGIVSTNITSIGTNAQPLFVNPQVNNNAITVKIHDFSANALSGNTSQDGFFFDCSTLTNAGVELSRFDNIIFNGFKGAVVHFKATQDGVSGSIGCTQGNTLTNITAIRPTGATGASQNALRIEGGAGQFDFINCWFDGQSSDTGTNVFVGTTGTQAPYSIRFHDSTNQNGFAYLIDGCNGCMTENDHLEVIKGVYNFANTASPVVGFRAETPYINSNVASNAGNGYIVNIPVGAPGTDVIIESPLMGGQPDKCVINAANGANVQILNAQYQPSNTPTNVCVTSGMTFTAAPAATLDIKRAHTVQLSASGTSITTLKSDLQPGESVIFYASGGTVQFGTGGNLSLGPYTTPLIIPSGGSATFMRVDAGTPVFVLTSATLINTVTLKKGSAGGSYTTASTTYVVVDATNLCYTVTIPVGWKLAIQSQGSLGTSTAAVAVNAALTDNAACSTANSGILVENAFQAVGAGATLPFNLVWAITGDGAAHNIALQFKTSNGADSALLANSSSTFLPTMLFTLTPSN